MVVHRRLDLVSGGFCSTVIRVRPPLITELGCTVGCTTDMGLASQGGHHEGERRDGSGSVTGHRFKRPGGSLVRCPRVVRCGRSPGRAPGPGLCCVVGCARAGMRGSGGGAGLLWREPRGCWWRCTVDARRPVDTTEGPRRRPCSAPLQSRAIGVLQRSTRRSDEDVAERAPTRSVRAGDGADVLRADRRSESAGPRRVRGAPIGRRLRVGPGSVDPGGVSRGCASVASTTQGGRRCLTAPPASASSIE